MSSRKNPNRGCTNPPINRTTTAIDRGPQEATPTPAYIMHDRRNLHPRCRTSVRDNNNCDTPPPEGRIRRVGQAL